MGRALSFAVGVIALTLGLESLALDRVVFHPREEETVSAPPGFNTPIVNRREYQIPDWAPWSLLSVGAVVTLYTYTLPKRKEGQEPPKEE